MIIDYCLLLLFLSFAIIIYNFFEIYNSILFTVKVFYHIKEREREKKTTNNTHLKGVFICIYKLLKLFEIMLPISEKFTLFY
jgi:hypothetical protein